jgi:NAD(P)-dependent dehydrogenase (short-subunit alcohol dehydrogenase family)
MISHRYEVARSFIKAGARVILVNRKEEQGDEAIRKLKEETGGSYDVEWVGCDLGSLKQTKEVFDGIAEKEERLDLVSQRQAEAVRMFRQTDCASFDSSSCRLVSTRTSTTRTATESTVTSASIVSVASLTVACFWA